MIIGVHFLIYSTDAPKDRAFFTDVLGYPFVDAGGGWLIFAMPPAEAAVHPGSPEEGHELYLLTDDVHKEIAALKQRGITCSEIQEPAWGSLTKVSLPGGGLLGLYQPKHPMALASATRRRKAASRRARRP